LGFMGWGRGRLRLLKRENNSVDKLLLTF